MTFNDLSDELANFVRKKRRQARLSQKELAEKVNISQSAVAAIERADAVRLKTVFKIFQTLQLHQELAQVFDFLKAEREGFSKSMEKKLQAIDELKAGVGLGENNESAARLRLTQGNINNGHIYLSSIIDHFPKSSIGGANKSEVAPNLLTIDAGLDEPICTDIAGDKKIFRSRQWVKEFFMKYRLKAGSTVTIRRLGKFKYLIRP